MALAKEPVTGMKDITLAEIQIREYVVDQIRKAYRGFRFSQTETPCVEHIEDLTSKQGGGNEKLILRILKRGDKLNLETAPGENDLVGSGLRHDLILPLPRYYANNMANLPSPFKALQMGSVQRVDGPQKRRSRQFVQCGIDILGDSIDLAEVKLILATTAALGKIYPDSAFAIRINDREILKGMTLYYGFPEDSADQVFITLDKMNKIDLGGVEKEPLGSGYQKEYVDKYLDMLKSVTRDADGVWVLGQELADVMPLGVGHNLARIMDTAAEVSEADFGLEFDLILVCDMFYYTGAIFEVSVEELEGSAAGGGRYDKMIGEFTGMETLTCGFSIGFERIVTILMDSGFEMPEAEEKKAYLFEKGVDSTTLVGVIKEAMEEHRKGAHILVVQTNKNEKSQKEQPGNEDYTESRELYKESSEK